MRCSPVSEGVVRACCSAADVLDNELRSIAEQPSVGGEHRGLGSPSAIVVEGHVEFGVVWLGFLVTEGAE